MTFSAANKYHAYARECLKLAETATTPDIREKLIELSRVWMEAALNEERHHVAEFFEPPDSGKLRRRVRAAQPPARSRDG